MSTKTHFFNPEKNAPQFFFPLSLPPHSHCFCALILPFSILAPKKKYVAKTTDAKETKSHCKKRELREREQKNIFFLQCTKTNKRMLASVIQFHKCHILNCNSSRKYSTFTTCYINYQITSFVLQFFFYIQKAFYFFF